MKRLFILIICSLFSINAQELDPKLLNNLSDEQKKEIQQILNVADIYNAEDAYSNKQVESLQDIKIEDSNILDTSKFGYDFFNKMPTSVLASGDLPLPNDYVISLGDKFTVILSGSKDIRFDLDVLLNGTILFPELGSVYVAGKTFEELKNDLSSLVSEFYIGVNVDIAAKTLNAKKISIIGAVKTPGVYLVNPFTTISNALAYAGGIEEYGSLREVILIKANGEKTSFDLYDLLIFGDRSKDNVIGAGDTIIINGTDNYVEIKGSVIRPAIYEYNKKDTYEDLINFALGLNFNAESTNITATSFENGKTSTFKIQSLENIGDKNLLEIYIGATATFEDIDIFVTGSGVTSGYFPTSGQDFSEFIEKLKFSDDVYPFYAIYEQKINSGLTRSKKSFSLADPQTYKDFKATKNSRIFFYDREYISNLNEMASDNLNEMASGNLKEIELENPALKSDYIQILLPESNMNIPITGSVSPRQIHNFFGITDDISIDNVAIITTEKSISNAYNEYIDSENLVAISLPAVRENLIEVDIQGEVVNPGKYLVSSSTNLNDLYTLAGGFRETAFGEGIQIYREDIKAKQEIAIKEAKSILTDSMIQKSSSLSERGMVDIEAILRLADLVEPNGRIAGDFSLDSDILDNFILKDKDIISVPQVSVEVTVEGEVLNSTSFIFNNDYSYKDYIEASGGFTPYADKRSVFIIRANGQSISSGNNVFSGQIEIKPGDTIVVPRDLDQIEALPLISIATKIISDIAFSAASLNAISN